ncbi:MAG: tetratricopeptide repeat protein [Planctomycetota bacterium]
MARSRRARRRLIRRLIIVAGIAAAFGVVAASLHIANTIQTRRMIAESRTEGMAAFERQDYAEAVRSLALYNARVPGDPEITFALAKATSSLPDLSRDDTAAAAAFALTAAGLMPGNIEPTLIEIEMRRRLGQHTELLSAAERALRIDEVNKEASTAKVQALAALGRRDEALDAALAFAQRLPDDPASHRLVLVMLTSLDPASATGRVLDYAEQLGQSHPNDPRVIILTAQAFAQVREPERAVEAAQRLSDPSISAKLDASALADATRLLDILSQRDAAEKLLESFLARQPDSPEIAAISIERAYQQGRIELAADRATTALDAADRVTPELKMWARLCDVDAEAPESGFHGYVVRGLEGLTAGDAAAAARDFETARTIEPASRVAQHLFAVALDRLGNPAEAERTRERLLRVAPTYTIARLAHIRALLDQRRADEAAAFARLGLQLEPTSGGLALALVFAEAERAAAQRANRREINQAIAIARTLDSGSDAATPATPPLARLLLAAGDLTGATAAIDRLITSAASDATALLLVARDARRAGLPAAAELLTLAERNATSDAKTLLDVTTAMHEDGRTEDAIELADRAAAGRPNDRSFALARAVFLDRIGSPEAADQFASIFDQTPNDPAALTTILESSAAWTNESLIKAAVTSLQEATSATSNTWRFYEARRLLSFEPSDARAAEAVRLLEPLASAATGSPRVSVLLAEALLRLGDADAALNQLALAADTGLQDPSLLLRLGWLHNAQGDIEAARRRARAIANVDPIEPALQRERIALLATVGLLDEAHNDAEELAQSGRPRDVALAATIAARAGRTDALQDQLRRLESLPDLEPAVVAVAGDLFVRLGDVSRAFEILERSRPAADSPAFARAEAAVLNAAKQQDRAVARLTDAYRLSGEAIDAARAAQSLASAGRVDQALALIEQAIETAPDDATLATLRTAIELDNAALSAIGENEDAASRTVAALKRQIENPDETARFIEDLRWVTSVTPTYYPAWALLTDALKQLGRIDEAAEAAASAMRLLPTDPRPARLAVGALLGLEPATRALGAAREWQARSRPDTYEADTTAAALLVRLGRIDEAASLLQAWSERIERDADVPPVLFRIYAASLINSGRAQTASELFERRRDADPRWLGHQIETARDLIRFHDEPDQARDWLERVAAATGDDPHAALRIAQAAVDLADRTGAPDDLRRAVDSTTEAQRLATDADDASAGRAATTLGVQALRFSEDAAAAADLARSLTAEDPSDTTAHVLLAAAVIESAGDPTEAIEAAQRAAQLAPGSSVTLDALGRAQLFAGDAESAEQSFRKAISADATEPSPRVGLAEALIALGREGDARRVIRDSLLRRDVARRVLLTRRSEQIINALDPTTQAGGSDFQRDLSR